MTEAVENLSTLVSVIIPAYNRESVIGRSIQSVLNQTHQEFEIIVVDDASTDNTQGAVKAFDDSRIRCIRHSENKFAAAARNTGMKAARGNYIAFLDSDDEWLPEKLSKQLAALNARDSSWRAIYSGAFIFKDYLTNPTLYAPQLRGSFLRDYLLMKVFILTPTFLFARDILPTIGFMDESFRRAEDIDFYVRILKKYKIDVVSEPLAKVYLDTTKPVADLHSQCMAALFKKHDDVIRGFGKLYSRQAHSRSNLNLAKLAFVEGRIFEGLKYWSTSTLQFPQLHPKRLASTAYFAFRGLRRRLGFRPE